MLDFITVTSMFSLLYTMSIFLSVYVKFSLIASLLMEHPVFQCFEHCWLNRVTKLEYTLVIYCNIESVILEFYNGFCTKTA